MADEKQGNEGTHTVWSPIKYHQLGEEKELPNGVKSQATELKTLMPGSKISKNHPAVGSEEQWNDWLEGGVVRKTPWPKGLNPTNPNALSPNAHKMAELRKQRERMEAEMQGVGGEFSPAGNEGEDTVSTAHHPG